MKFITYSHKFADIIFKEERYSPIYKEIVDAISSISDEDLIQRHSEKHGQKMSLSHTINGLLDEKLVSLGWMPQAPIFQEEDYQGEKWRLDFAKDSVSIEVGFNHGEAIAWNLLKPVLASEQNHIKKAIQTKVAVMICATKALKVAGAFDSAVGEYEKVKRYLVPLDRVLTTPLLLIGLEAPETFKLTKDKSSGKNIGSVVKL